jgi:hypothetical protein
LISLIAFIPIVAITMPPPTGTAPPDFPVPAARGTTGTSARLATASALAMSSGDEASTTASGTTGSASDSSNEYAVHESREVSTFDGPRARSRRI